ncbi:class I adenylate-forming enzyme family protein [Dinoroseobacter shibae]|jgi:acyl-coenzyme A synthetase/AMP-(fatty) acid ligase|nr:class I adenylate-forming enzyme family protein [Dinoroseobacter shibae]URF48218.1 acyl--CoA ligase [Dinoroseobacter shibae]URF52528.1 acyl--CoA ligase [Dinoroseobacter shibae]
MPLPDDFDPAAPCPAPFNLAGYVLAAGDEDKIALEVLGGGAVRWTFGDLRRAVAGYAAALRTEGLAPGDKLLMRLGNTVEFPLLFLAAVAAGVVPVPTSAALTVEEVDWIAADLAPALTVQAPGVAGPSRGRVVALEALVPDRDAPLAPVPGDPDRMAYVVYTSGSSGRPRAVAHAHRAIWARRMMWRDWYGMGPEDRILHAGAFNWTYTLGVGLLDPWAMGATALIPEAGTDSAALPEALAASGASIFAAVPGVYRQILKQEALPRLPRLRHGLTAGEALPDSLRAAWRDRVGTELYEALGMSECSTFISAHPGRQAPPGHAGFAQAGRRIAALDADGVEVARGTSGVLGVHRGDPGLMLGYLEGGRPRLPLTGDWFVTGDMVEIASDGAVRYLGRGDDMMNAGGFRVSPLEVEKAFHGRPEIGEAAAVEVKIKADVTVIALFYVAAAPVTEAALAAEAAQHLARYKQPRLYIPVETLPKGRTGKLDRRALRAAYEARHDQA